MPPAQGGIQILSATIRVASRLPGTDSRESLVHVFKKRTAHVHTICCHPHHLVPLGWCPTGCCGSSGYACACCLEEACRGQLDHCRCGRQGFGQCHRTFGGLGPVTCGLHTRGLEHGLEHLSFSRGHVASHSCSQFSERLLLPLAFTTFYRLSACVPTEHLRRPGKVGVSWTERRMLISCVPLNSQFLLMSTWTMWQ